jgi:hypothetical protein
MNSYFAAQNPGFELALPLLFIKTFLLSLSIKQRMVWENQVMNIYILIPQIDSRLYEFPIGAYSSRELAFQAIKNDYVEHYPSVPLGDIQVQQLDNVEVLTCVNKQEETVISYNIILKVLDDAYVESLLIS